MRSWLIGAGLDSLEGKGDGGRLGPPTKMARTTLFLGLLEQHDRGVVQVKRTALRLNRRGQQNLPP